MHGICWKLSCCGDAVGNPLSFIRTLKVGCGGQGWHVAHIRCGALWSYGLWSLWSYGLWSYAAMGKAGM